MSNSKSKKLIISLSFLIFTLYSCFDIELVEKGEITLTTDWSQRDQLVNIPISYAVKINNQILNFNSITNSLPDLYPDNYPVWVYNRPDHVQIDDGKARVSSANGVLNPLPGWLFTGFAQISYENNTIKDFRIKMSQQIRQLQIKLVPTGGISSNVKQIQGILSGIAGTWNFEKEIPEGKSENIPLAFKKHTDGSWIAMVRVLGTIGDQQKLIANISFEDPLLQNIPLTSDLSNGLSEFNKDKHVPITLAAEVETKTESEFSITVNDWIKVQESGTAW